MNELRLEPFWSMLLIGSLGAMWAWWGKQFHEPKYGSGHVCRVIAWTRQQGLLPYIGFENVRGELSCCLTLCEFFKSSSATGFSVDFKWQQVSSEVFWPISTILWCGWSWFFLWLLINPAFFLNLWKPFQKYQLPIHCHSYEPHLFWYFDIDSFFLYSFESFSHQP